MQWQVFNKLQVIYVGLSFKAFTKGDITSIVKKLFKIRLPCKVLTQFFLRLSQESKTYLRNAARKATMEEFLSQIVTADEKWIHQKNSKKILGVARWISSMKARDLHLAEWAKFSILWIDFALLVKNTLESNKYGTPHWNKISLTVHSKQQKT